MRTDRTAPRFSLALALAGLCASGCDLDAQTSEAPSAWELLDEVPFAAIDGELLTPPIVVPNGAQGFALFVELDGCAQIARLEDEDTTWVPQLESGTSCGLCEERQFVVADAGLFTHAPREPSPPGPATLQLGRIDCATLTRARPSDQPDGTVRLWTRPLPPDPGGVLEVPLRLHHGEHSAFADRADTERLLAATDALLAPAGVHVTLVESRVDGDVPSTIRWSSGDLGELPALVDPRGPVVDVVLAGCLEQVQPSGTRTVLDGFVPRVPAVGADGAGVFLRGRECGAGAPRTIAWSDEVMSRRLAHELGHFFGLHHTVELDGRRDDLPDTDDGTLLAPDPTIVEDPSLTPQQIARMRTHVLLLGDARPRDAP